MKKLLLVLLLSIIQNSQCNWQDNLKWAAILSLPALSLQLIEKKLPVTYYDQSNADFHDRLAFFPATFFLSACDRVIDQNPTFEKYYVDLVRNGLSLLLCNILYAYQHGERNISQKRIIYPFEPFFGIMPGVPSGQLARYVSVFKLVNYIFKNVLKLHVEPMHI
ncbi:MAG: hypothetical protein P4L22_00690 [Candidatus Babeliales bacterium]|nr:hypothetical protein [Candidatus Babeliales bacterium]